MANWTFDKSDYTERSFSIIPVGDYRVRIEDVTERTFKSGNEGYEIVLAVNGYSSKLWFYLVLDPSNKQATNQRIGEFFDSFGIASTAMGSGRQWIGAVGAVRVKHEQYNGNAQAKVAFVISRERQATLPAWKNAPATAAAPVNIAADLPFDLDDELPL